MTIRSKLALVLLASLAMTAVMGLVLHHGASGGRALVEGEALLDREGEFLDRIGHLGAAAAADAGGARDRLGRLATTADGLAADWERLRGGEPGTLGPILPGLPPAPGRLVSSMAAWTAELRAAAGREGPVGPGEAAAFEASFNRDVRPALSLEAAERRDREAALKVAAGRGIEDGLRLARWMPLAAFALVGALGAWLFVPLGARLRRLALAARRIGRGELQVGLPAGGKDELAEVETSFDAMTRDLSRTIEERTRLVRERAEAEDQVLRAYNARLEAAVEARTAELAAANRELRQRFVELQATKGRLLVADRMATIGLLAAGIGHEINNPLTYVTANLAFVADELTGPVAALDAPALAELRTALDEARDGAARIQAIVRDLRTVARDAPGDRRPVDVGGALKAAVKLAAQEIRPRARLTLDLAPAPRVLADEGKLTQVFLNLLVNASQALPEERGERNEIRVSVRSAAEAQVIAEIADNGMGIPAENLGRIFDPFFTTKPVGKGTGLGLSVCHGIVTGLGGSISVTSEVEHGTVFRVTLPAAPDVAAREAG